MSFKLIIVCATLAVVSCAHFESEKLTRQQQQQQQEMVQNQQEMTQQQNERIRDQQRVESQQQADQMRDLEDQRRRQEQMIVDQQQKRLDNIRSNDHLFLTTRRPIVPASVQYVVVPSSRRNVEYLDDSNYNFSYGISDLTTGDIKSQQEVRRGDQVQGQYTMMDADGYHRVVDYRADDQNGFDAEVRREPALIAPQVFFSYVPQYYRQQVAAVQQPTIYSSTSVSRRDDGKRSQYTSTTASNF
jgi:Insect cuticle protein